MWLARLPTGVLPGVCLQISVRHRLLRQLQRIDDDTIRQSALFRQTPRLSSLRVRIVVRRTDEPPQLNSGFLLRHAARPFLLPRSPLGQYGGRTRTSLAKEH